MIIAFKGLRQNEETMQMYIEKQEFQPEKCFESLIVYDVLCSSAVSAAVR